jgi:glycosyltransferase involved in cell wall biosynthesis
LALGKPVVTLNAGAAMHQVSADSGYLVAPDGQENVITSMADAMTALANNAHMYLMKSRAAQARFRSEFCADVKVPVLARLLSDMAAEQRET